MSLYRFFGSETQVNHQRMEKLLRLLQKHTRPVRPELLGVIGEEHLRELCIRAGGEPKSFKYFASPGHDDDGRPYMVEIATCPSKNGSPAKTKRRERLLVTGVNFSATLENPFDTFRGMEGMDEILTELRAGSARAGHRLRPLRLSAHRVSGPRQKPHRLGVKIMGAADDIKKGLTKNLANFTKQRKAEEKHSQRRPLADVAHDRSPRHVSDRSRQRGHGGVLHEGVGQQPTAGRRRGRSSMSPGRWSKNRPTSRSSIPISARRCCRITSTSMARIGTSSMMTAGISRSRTPNG